MGVNFKAEFSHVGCHCLSKWNCGFVFAFSELFLVSWLPYIKRQKFFICFLLGSFNEDVSGVSTDVNLITSDLFLLQSCLSFVPSDHSESVYGKFSFLIEKLRICFKFVTSNQIIKLIEQDNSISIRISKEARKTSCEVKSEAFNHIYNLFLRKPFMFIDWLVTFCAIVWIEITIIKRPTLAS